MYRLFRDRKLQFRGYEFSQWLVDTIILFTIQPTIHGIDNKQRMETKPATCTFSREETYVFLDGRQRWACFFASEIGRSWGTKSHHFMECNEISGASRYKYVATM